MVPKRTSRVEVLGSAFRFLAIFNVLVVVAALVQIPAASPRHATVAGSTQQQAVRNASDSSLSAGSDIFRRLYALRDRDR